jgi:transcriptional regulator with XRE-family HTH domain
MSTPTPASVIRSRASASSYRKLAKELDVSAGHLNHIVHGRRQPGDDLLRKLGLESVTIYRRKRS